MLKINALCTGLIGPVDLELPAGRIAVLSGVSGSGKSLLLRAIADLDPNEGRVELNGRARGDFDATDWRRHVAFVPAESGWWAQGVDEHFQAEPDPAPLLETLGLGEAMHWDVARLSTGEKQRLALARALQMDADVLLLDEPTSALDAMAVEAVEGVIRAEAAKGKAVLLVSHDTTQGARLGDVFFKLEDGQVRDAA
ncbi:MAG: ATP-binding cassette domain-containing protein [Rhodobacteraceae bacterium]|nr:ATP-binding cassette domain-containing protein [Paracoccaceae bacterium]